MFAVTVLFTIATVSQAFAENITKSFEFGPGLAYKKSVVRTFPIPCGLQIAAVVKFRRLSGGNDNVPIAIELREPDASPGVEGPIVDTRNEQALTTEQSVTINSIPSNRGCAQPWRVRVRYTGTGEAPVAVFGTAKIDFDGRSKSISTQTPGFIGKRTYTEVNIGGTTGFDQGQLEITANWNHMIGLVPGPNPIKFRLILAYLIDNNPSNQLIVASTEAYSSNETRGLKKFHMIGKIHQRSHGQWKLYVTNEENDHDAFMFAPTVTFKPICP